MTYDEWRQRHATLFPELDPEAARRAAWDAATERAARIVERTAVLCEQRAGAEPARDKYSLAYSQADRNAAAELRDAALLIRENA